MQEKTKFTLIAAAVALVFVLFNSLYILPQTEQAIVLQFGEPVRLVKEPGLKFKVPFIQNVVFYDNRLLNLDPPAQEIVLNDKKRLDVDSFTRFRIIDPLKFYQTVRTEEQARSKLKEIVNSSVRKILGRHHPAGIAFAKADANHVGYFRRRQNRCPADWCQRG